MTERAATGYKFRWDIVLIFGLLGPQFGVLVFALPTTLYLSLNSPPDQIPQLFGGLLMFIAIGAGYTYVTGGLQALATGFILAIWAMKTSKISYMKVLISTASVGVITFIVLTIVSGFELYHPGAALGIIGVLSGLCLRLAFSKRFGTPTPPLHP